MIQVYFFELWKSLIQQYYKGKYTNNANFVKVMMPPVSFIKISRKIVFWTHADFILKIL